MKVFKKYYQIRLEHERENDWVLNEYIRKKYAKIYCYVIWKHVKSCK